MRIKRVRKLKEPFMSEFDRRVQLKNDENERENNRKATNKETNKQERIREATATSDFKPKNIVILLKKSKEQIFLNHFRNHSKNQICLFKNNPKQKTKPKTICKMQPRQNDTIPPNYRFKYAFCSFGDNKVTVRDKEKETHEIYQGATVSGNIANPKTKIFFFSLSHFLLISLKQLLAWGITRIIHIPRTNYLISSSCAYPNGSFQVLDVSKEMKIVFKVDTSESST